MTTRIIDPTPQEIELSRGQNGLVFLPRSIDANGRYNHESSAVTLKKVFKEHGISVELLVGENGSGDIQENAFELVLPVIFIGATLYSSNPDIHNVAINVLSNFIFDFFRGIKGSKKVRASVIITRKNGEQIKAEYDGPPENFSEMKDMINAAKDKK